MKAPITKDTNRNKIENNGVFSYQWLHFYLLSFLSFIQFSDDFHLSVFLVFSL